MSQLLLGKRILKTGLAVFITAQICHWLDWPSIFAIIAAIVTLEPSIDMSIKKGIYRLPSAAIGAMFAMLFDALLGQQPVTYMLSAVATIYVIQFLKWNDSIVIATLTSVNMITLTDNDFGENFLVRIGTTATGIVVSALINYFIFPPKYYKSIHKSLPLLSQETLELANHIVGHSLHRSSEATTASLTERLDALQLGLSRTLQNISWQLADYRYKSPNKVELRQMLTFKRTIGKLRAICSYLDIIVHSPTVPSHVKDDILNQLWEQWLHFETNNHPIHFPTTIKEEVLDDESRFFIESLFYHIEYIHILIRQLPQS